MLSVNGRVLAPTLPDSTEVKTLNGLNAYLGHDRIDQVAFSFLNRAACYAVGRSLTAVGEATV